MGSKIPVALQIQYRGKIPGKLADLLDSIDEMRVALHEETLKTFRERVHKMAGSAGTYGYMQVTLLCKEFEQEILKKIQDPVNSPEWIALCDAYLTRIETAFQKPSE